MAFDETFRPTPKINEIETFQLIGKPREFRELRPSNFDGPVAEWADWRMHALGETIVPRHVYIDSLPGGEEHRVAWVYHDGFNPDSATSYCMHHVACDCSLEVDHAETLEERAEIMSNCPSLTTVLQRRAWLVNATYGIDTILNHYTYDAQSEPEEQSPEVRQFLSGAIAQILEHDFRHPESWMANVESGWNLVNLLAVTLQIPPEHVLEYAQQLERMGYVELNDDAVSLSASEKARIQNEQDFQAIIKGF